MFLTFFSSFSCLGNERMMVNIWPVADVFPHFLWLLNYPWQLSDTNTIAAGILPKWVQLNVWFWCFRFFPLFLIFVSCFETLENLLIERTKDQQMLEWQIVERRKHHFIFSPPPFSFFSSFLNSSTPTTQVSQSNCFFMCPPKRHCESFSFYTSQHVVPSPKKLTSLNLLR